LIGGISDISTSISFFLMLALLGLGLLFVFSATYKPEAHYSLFFKKQLFGVGAGMVIYFFFCGKDFRKLARWGLLGIL